MRISVGGVDILLSSVRRLFRRLEELTHTIAGPHPRWSCQLAFAPELFGDIVPWLALHRDGLSVLVHPNTGHDVLDHSDRAMWMGEILPLDFSVLDT